MPHKPLELRLDRRLDIRRPAVADFLHQLERGELRLLGAGGDFGEGLGWGVSRVDVKPWVLK